MKLTWEIENIGGKPVLVPHLPSKSYINRLGTESGPGPFTGRRLNARTIARPTSIILNRVTDKGSFVLNEHGVQKRDFVTYLFT
jgi:hypothetical protein